MILPKTEGFRPSDAAEYGVLPVTFEDIWLVSSTNWQTFDFRIGIIWGKGGGVSSKYLVIKFLMGIIWAKGVVSHQNIW